MHYVPIGPVFFVVLWLVLAGVILLIEVGVLQHVFAQLGVSRRFMFGLLVVSLLGSYVNIPVARLAPERVHSGEIVDYFGIPYMIPTVVDWPATIIAVNLGGAIIPLVLSIYLVAKHRQYGSSFLAIALVALVVHALAQPVAGVGIGVPIFIPPLVAAVVAGLISREYPAPLAYVGGSMGTLLGADLMNLDRIRGLGAPVASIGGAGKFDGIFLTGIIAVILAGLWTRWRRPAGSDEFGGDPSRPFWR